MDYNIQFQLCGLFLVTLILGLYIRHKSLSLPSEKVYARVLWAVELYLIFDIASIFSIYIAGDEYGAATELVCKICLFLLPHVSFMILFYALTDIQNGKGSLKKEYRRYSGMLIILPFLLLFTTVEYKGNGANMYMAGSAVILSYIFNLTFLLLAFAYTLHYREKMNHQRRNSIYFLVGSCIIGMAVQILYPSVLILGYGLALSMVFMYMRLENPGENTDKVSGCFNQDALVAYIQDKEEHQRSYAALAIAFDDFRFVNETFGSTNGNQIISAVADFLHALKGAVVFRGMELEFTLIFDKRAEQEQALREIKSRFQEAWNEFGVDVNLSIGIVYLTDCHLIENAQELPETLHYFIQEGKHRGKGVVIEIDKQELSYKREMDNADSALRWAMKNDKVEVFYQPIYSMKEKTFVSAEALVRISDERGKSISPELFIPISERNGLILELGMIVFEKVCQFMKTQQLLQDGIRYIEINLSVVQCMQEDLAQELLAVMQRYDIAPERINLEITETAAVNSEKTLIQNMERLIARKVTFSLDDYGSGYSNLSYIVGLPLQIVKIDKSLVWSSFENEKAKVAMEFAVSMIRQLGMKVLAEGIETREQYMEMERMGIDFIQGYLFSKPVPESTFMKVIRTEITAHLS